MRARVGRHGGGLQSASHSSSAAGSVWSRVRVRVRLRVRVRVGVGIRVRVRVGVGVGIRVRLGLGLGLGLVPPLEQVGAQAGVRRERGAELVEVVQQQRERPG